MTQLGWHKSMYHLSSFKMIFKDLQVQKQHPWLLWSKVNSKSCIKLLDLEIYLEIYLSRNIKPAGFSPKTNRLWVHCLTNIEFYNKYEYIQKLGPNANIFVCWFLVKYEYEVFWDYNLTKAASNSGKCFICKNIRIIKYSNIVDQLFEYPNIFVVEMFNIHIRISSIW